MDNELKAKAQEIVQGVVAQTLERNHPKYGVTEEATDAIYQLVVEERLHENAWSRGQMIAMQVLEAPNSGFGRQTKLAIKVLNERKAELQSQLSSIGESK